MSARFAEAIRSNNNRLQGEDMQEHPTRSGASLNRRLALALTVAAVAFGTLTAAAPAGAQAALPQDKIIISGASGQLGGLTVKALLARGVPAKNLILVSRTPQTLAEYAKLGASTRFGDFNKPESLAAAYAGGTRMLLISVGLGPTPRPEVHKRAIDAAVAAGVKQIAYTSYVALSMGDTSGLGADHAATEEILKKSGAAWTMLRNSIYMQGLIPQAAKMLAEGQASVPPNESRIGYVTREDCAAAAAAVLSTPGHDNKAYNITGPDLIGVRETATAATAATGKAIKVSLADPNAKAPARGFGGPALAVTSTDVATLTGRPATGVTAFFKANKEKLLGAGK
jgi:NAD(P)H dehydrogenase (quinone)